jgi:fructose-bisphosphate aldolase class I
MDKSALEKTAKAMVEKGKGILAADESNATVTKRFEAVKIVSSEAARQAYRDLLFTAPAIEEYISGVIMYDETIRQNALNGLPFPALLAEKGIIPGIKVDKGAKDMAGFPGEKITEGLDGLRERLGDYYKLGARFAKWRAVITIAKNLPSRSCMAANAHALARYAALCQENDIVPIIEPETLMDGDHTIERCFEVTRAMLKTTFSEMMEMGVYLEGLILKPNMVVAGKGCPQQASVPQVAEMTLRCLRETVPAAVPGVAFLSGGQNAVLATEHLNAMNSLGEQPWEVSFSFARALQDPAISTWRGEPGNVTAAQKAFSHRARCNSAARFGKYTITMESI